MTVTLYQIAPSFYSQIARLALEEKGVEWSEHAVNIGPPMENYEPWFMRINPKGVVPALDHDGVIVVEAINIIKYIDAHFAGPRLTPEDGDAQQQMEAWLARFNGFRVRELSYGLTLSKPVGAIVGHSFEMRQKVLARHMRRTPELGAHYQVRIDDIAQWKGVSSDPDRVAELKAQALGMLDDVNAALARGGPWLVGSTFTLGDVWLIVFLARLKQFGVFDPSACAPELADYWTRAWERPSVVRADIWDGIRIGFMVRLVAPFLLPRLGAATAAVSGVAYLGWWVVQVGAGS